jgi:DNA-binding CsgD family transcriptional regulator
MDKTKLDRSLDTPMSKIIDLEQHFCITCADKVSKIAAPLVTTFDIKHFRYLKVFHDGSRIILSNYPDCVRYTYEEGNYVNMWFDNARSSFLQERWHHWNINSVLDASEVNTQLEKEISELLGLSHGITSVEVGDNFYEVFSFDTDHANIYLIDKTLLSRFIFYFRDTARHLIKRAESEKIILPSKAASNRISEQVMQEMLSYLSETTINRYYLGPQYNDTYLTAKEVSCIYWMLSGKTAEEIGLITNTRPKTIQRHLENIKFKLNCAKQTQIIKIFLESDLAKILNMHEKLSKFIASTNT